MQRLHPINLNVVRTMVALLAFVPIASPTNPGASVSFDLTFPSGLGLSRVTVGGSVDLFLGANDRIDALDGSPGTVTNAGNGLLSVGPMTSGGSLVSIGNILLAPNVTATSVQSSGTVTFSPGDTVGTVAQGAVLTPLVHRIVSVPAMSGTPSDVSISAGASESLPPGRYGQVMIGPRAIVTVSPGVYLVDNFALGTDAELMLNTSGDSVSIYVNNSVTWNGTVSGDASRFIFGFLGHGSLIFNSPFRGTALAPFGTLQLNPNESSSTVYQGTFYGQHVVVGPGITIQKLSTPLLIDGFSVSNATPCIGEPAEALLDATSAGPDATTWIEGVVGSHQFVQFSDAPGPRLLWAAVYTPAGRADFTSVPITVQKCATPPGVAPPIALHFWGALRKPNIVEFMIHNYDANGHEIAPAGPTTYAWSFGDGQMTTTSSPFISHDYTAAVKPLARYSYFDVSVTATNSTGSATARKVVPILSLYAENRAKGIIQPANKLSISPSNLALAVTNYEPTSISITQANVELIPCDPALNSTLQTPQTLAVTISAGATTTVNVVPPSTIPSDICSVGVHLTGKGDFGRVYTDAYTSLKENRLLVHAITDPNMIAFLNQASTLAQDPNHFDEFELRQLYGQGLISQLPPSDPPQSTSSKVKSDPPSVGGACSPGDIDMSLGLVCEPTSGWVFIGPEILNAFKGNFVMDHGCGFIGQLLSSVNQLYSHTSTIVENREMVRHSTASPDRMNSNVDYIGERLDPNTLQFGFPGTAGSMQAYTIDQMVNQYTVTDPDDPTKQWTMGGELSPNPVKCNNDTSAIPSLVIRPVPDAPGTVLQGVASVANNAGINGHYRFFNYSRADKLLPGSDWAVGTESTVCSSFDRLAAVGAGLPLHPNLQVPGVPDGMMLYTVDTRSKAGQALFAQVANQVAQSCDPETAGTGGAIIGGASGLLGGPAGVVIGGVLGVDYCLTMIGNIANQVSNCFANDLCDDTNPDWVNPGMGIAVSPDDMRQWDPWCSADPNANSFCNGKQPGTYGYEEPVVYNPKAWRHAYAWAAPQGSGSITVKVVDPNKTPFPNATVLINTNALGTTDSTGTFQIPVIAAGVYQVGAQFFCGNGCTCQPAPGSTCTSPVLEQANTSATLPPNGSITVTLTLCAGPLVGGVPTSCPQPGQSGSNLKACVSITMDDASDPFLALNGSGFTPGGPIQVGYTGVPGNLYGLGATEFCCADGAGNLTAIAIGQGQGQVAFCTQGTVTIGIEDPLAFTATQVLVPNKYWCIGNGLGPGDGPFNYGDLSVCPH